jgi:hypothetical protein
MSQIIEGLFRVIEEYVSGLPVRAEKLINQVPGAALPPTGNTGSGYTPDPDAVTRVDVRKNSTGSVFSRRRLNLIEGSNVTLTVADDSGNEEVDITIAASGGGSALTIEEVDGSPTVSATTLKFPNGTLGVVGTVATYTPAGGGSLEVNDGTTTVTPVSVIVFPSGTITDNGSGEAEYTPAGGGSSFDNPMTAEGDYIVGSASGLTNQATVGQGASATASSTLGGSSAGNAIDVNDSTYWQAAGSSAPYTLTIDLGTPRAVIAFRLLQYAPDAGYRATDYVVESAASGGGPWTAQYTTVGTPATDTGDLPLGGTVTAQYWRATATDTNNSGIYGWVVPTFALYTGVVAGTPVRAPGGGTTGARPGSPVLYQMYFDTTLVKPIWWNGSAWKDATGSTV